MRPILEGKKVIITGGVTGCGRATAKACAEWGASVVTMSTAKPTDQRAVDTIADCEAVKPDDVDAVFKHITLDVSDQAACQVAFDAAVEFMGGLDAICLSHAVTPKCPTLEIHEDVMIKSFKVNTLGMIYMDICAYNYFAPRGGGAIVNFGSIAGIEGIDNLPAYSVAKGGINSISRIMAREWGGKNVRVNQLLPAVRSEASLNDEKELLETGGEAALKQYRDWINNSIPLDSPHKTATRQGDVIEAGRMAAFLCSDYARYVHGQLICVDGGMLFTR